jgi:hypothetical protein
MCKDMGIVQRLTFASRVIGQSDDQYTLEYNSDVLYTLPPPNIRG